MMKNPFKAQEPKFNHNALYSIASLALSFLAFLSAPFIADLSSGLSPVSITGYRMSLAAITFSVFMPYLLFVLLLISAGFFGIRAIIQTEKTEHRGRWLALITSTLSLTLLTAILIFNITEFI